MANERVCKRKNNGAILRVLCNGITVVILFFFCPFLNKDFDILGSCNVGVIAHVSSRDIRYNIRVNINMWNCEIIIFFLIACIHKNWNR